MRQAGEIVDESAETHRVSTESVSHNLAEGSADEGRSLRLKPVLSLPEPSSLTDHNLILIENRKVIWRKTQEGIREQAIMLQKNGSSRLRSPYSVEDSLRKQIHVTDLASDSPDQYRRAARRR